MPKILIPKQSYSQQPSSTTVVSQTQDNSENYNPAISSNCVIGAKNYNSEESLGMYLQIKNHLSEFKEEEDKKIARANLNVYDKDSVNNLITDSTQYDSDLSDELIIPETVGGIEKGTPLKELTEKTISQVLDQLLFPEIQPTVTEPSVSISITGSWKNNGIYEVGFEAPQETNFNITFNRGKSEVIGIEPLPRSGEETGRSLTYNDSELPLKIILGELRYKATISYSEGPELKTSKGNKASIDPNPLPEGTISNTASIYGVYPYYANNSDNASDSKLPLTKDLTITVNYVSENPNKHRFIVPEIYNLTKVQMLNTLSGKYEDISLQLFTQSSKVINVQGENINYIIHTRSDSGFIGSASYKFTIQKK